MAADIEEKRKENNNKNTLFNHFHWIDVLEGLCFLQLRC